MSKTGGKKHEKLLKETIKKLEKEKYRVIELKGKSPDAIAVKNNKIVAVEILGVSYNYKKKRWHKSWTYTQKEDNYSMFDRVIIKKFKRNRPPYQKGEGMISCGTLKEGGKDFKKRNILR